jgi:hypothetical protein
MVDDCRPTIGEAANLVGRRSLNFTRAEMSRWSSGFSRLFAGIAG